MSNPTESLKFSKKAMRAKHEGLEAYIAYLEKRRLIHCRAWHLTKDPREKEVHLRQWKEAKQLIKEMS